MKVFVNTKRNKKNGKGRTERGFSLVEMIVSLSIFVSVMLVIMGAVLSVLDINRKAQSQKTAMDNLNFALDSASRTIRFGQNYHCGTLGVIALPRDCQGGENVLTLRASDGAQVTYTVTEGVFTRSVNGAAPVALTSPEINIQSLVFRVFGSYPYGSDYFQPQVIITVAGVAGNANRPKDQTLFKLETTVSQRKLDI